MLLEELEHFVVLAALVGVAGVVARGGEPLGGGGSGFLERRAQVIHGDGTLAPRIDRRFDRLVHPGFITLSRLIELMSVNPARILGVPGGSLSEGAAADISLLAPDLAVTVAAKTMRSKSKNTPFDGWELKGGVAATIVAGRNVYVNTAVQHSGFQ